ncbi:MAG: sugar transferase [Candidatus Omnitrophota bacterium]|nr:sugar transferase [Candidatus Omnitrophota bacterium]
MLIKAISRRSLLLLVSDAVTIAISYAVAFYLRTGRIANTSGEFPPFVYFSIVIFLTLFYVFDLYYPFKHFNLGQTSLDVLFSVAIGTVISAAAAYLDRTLILPRYMFAITAGGIFPFVLLVRVVYDFIFKTRFLDKRTLILGSGKLAAEMGETIKRTPHSGLAIVGMVYEERKPNTKSKNGFSIVGGMKQLLSLIDWYNVDLVVLALDPDKELSETSVMSELLQRRVMVTSAVHLFEQIKGEVPYRLLGSHFLLGLMAQIRKRPYLKLKRLTDVVFASALLVILAPVLLLAMILLSFQGPTKIFFVQERVGRGGLPFQLIKLRSMRPGKDKKQIITGIGRWMRKFRVDEIPQLINVLKGDMSLIGPRPEIPYFVRRCRLKIPFYDAVFSVKPGLTGWAQIRFHHSTTIKEYDQKFRYNLYYLKNISLTLDLMIVLKTIRVVLLGKGK